MSIAALIRAMAEAGASPEAIALAVEAVEAAEAKVEQGRAAARERKRRQRDKAVNVTGQSRDMDVTVTPEPPSLSPSPQTPQPHTHPRGDISPARKGRAKPTGNAAFDTFWAAYPLSKGKDAAEPAFRRAMARIDHEDPLAVILAGIERALPGWDLETKKFIPHPATWLNAGSWDDEAPQPRRAEARNVRPDRHAAQHDHLSAVARAMAAACDRAEGEPSRNRPNPSPESGGRFLPAAA